MTTTRKAKIILTEFDEKGEQTLKTKVEATLDVPTGTSRVPAIALVNVADALLDGRLNDFGRDVSGV